MAEQTFNVAAVAIANVQIAIVHVDPASCSTPEMQSRSMKFFQARLQGKHVVLMYVDMTRKPVFLGPAHLAQALRGKGLSEFQWQKVVFR